MHIFISNYPTSPPRLNLRVFPSLSRLFPSLTSKINHQETGSSPRNSSRIQGPSLFILSLLLQIIHILPGYLLLNYPVEASDHMAAPVLLDLFLSSFSHFGVVETQNSLLFTAPPPQSSSSGSKLQCQRLWLGRKSLPIVSNYLLDIISVINILSLFIFLFISILIFLYLYSYSSTQLIIFRAPFQLEITSHKNEMKSLMHSLKIYFCHGTCQSRNWAKNTCKTSIIKFVDFLRTKEFFKSFRGYLYHTIGKVEGFSQIQLHILVLFCERYHTQKFSSIFFETFQNILKFLNGGVNWSADSQNERLCGPREAFPKTVRNHLKLIFPCKKKCTLWCVIPSKIIFPQENQKFLVLCVQWYRPLRKTSRVTVQVFQKLKSSFESLVRGQWTRKSTRSDYVFGLN
ncbi:hypothetical protein VP01_431g7 [Puccinia sorghi]|uniref:Uncharacterized protein n=1 Tax=Puccinia sorghi TaxID=27349 RepID=A0A0L6UQ08_9BASI|nr:hypothetical protein VP01_431g7 [Puccinia sorghi]